VLLLDPFDTEDAIDGAGALVWGAKAMGVSTRVCSSTVGGSANGMIPKCVSEDAKEVEVEMCRFRGSVAVGCGDWLP
jgi:hypothetical protein